MLPKLPPLKLYEMVLIEGQDFAISIKQESLMCLHSIWHGTGRTDYMKIQMLDSGDPGLPPGSTNY